MLKGSIWQKFSFIHPNSDHALVKVDDICHFVTRCLTVSYIPTAERYHFTNNVLNSGAEKEKGSDLRQLNDKHTLTTDNT